MNNIDRRNFVAGAGSIVLASSGSLAFAQQEPRLTFATTMPAGAASSQSDEYLNPWLDEIATKGKGLVQVTRRDGPNIATMANSYDRVLSDVVQIAWSLQPLLGGKFPLSEVGGLPFITDSTEVSSVALWRLYQTGMLDSEYQDVAPLWLMVSAQNKMHFAKAPKSMVDLESLKVNVFNRTLVQVVEKFKGTPVSVGPEQQYESLQRGNIDMTMTAWSGFNNYRLQEVTTYHVDAPFGSSTHMFFMSRKKFEALTPQARKVLTDASGEVQSRRHGKSWDNQETIQKQRLIAAGKHTIVDPTPDQKEELRRKIEPVVDAWAKGRPNGEKVLAKYREIVAQVESERKKAA